MKKNLDRLADSMLWFGIGLALLYWCIKFGFFLLDHRNLTLSSAAGAFASQGIYDAVIVGCLFLMFGSHAQFSIRKRRQAEESLRESEDKYRNILESIEEGYYEIGMDRRLSFANDAMSRMLGYRHPEIIGRPITEFVTPDYLEQADRLFSRVADDEQAVTTFECEFQNSRKAKRIIEMSASLIRDAKYRSTGFRGILRDVTERRMMERQLIQSLKNVQEARTGVILGLAKLAEYRDEDTGRHLERIREFTRILALELANHPNYRDYIDERYVEDIYVSSILHDIGKVGVSDRILLKPGRLTDEEFEEIKKHPLIGGNALSAVDAHMKDTSFLTLGKEIAFHHHEKWNGQGYPFGLAGDRIPLSARIVALADVYDALTSKRAYKEAYPHRKALEIIRDLRGEHFDPDIVDAFLIHQHTFEKIRAELHA